MRGGSRVWSPDADGNRDATFCFSEYLFLKRTRQRRPLKAIHAFVWHRKVCIAGEACPSACYRTVRSTVSAGLFRSLALAPGRRGCPDDSKRGWKRQRLELQRKVYAASCRRRQRHAPLEMRYEPAKPPAVRFPRRLPRKPPLSNGPSL